MWRTPEWILATMNTLVVLLVILVGNAVARWALYFAGRRGRWWMQPPRPYTLRLGGWRR